MPNFNLKGDAGKSAAKPVGEPPSMKSSGGGAVKTIVILLFAVLVIGGAAFFLNKAGIIKLWGKKPVQQALVQRVEYADSLEAAAQADTAGMVQFSGKEGAPAQQSPAKTKQEKQQPASKKNAVTQQTTKQPMAAASKQKTPAPKHQTAANATLGTGPFSIQLSSWASREKAEMEVEVLKQKGHPAFVQEAFVSGLGHRYRVNVGRFPSEAAAAEFAKKLTEQGSGGYLVMRIGT